MISAQDFLDTTEMVRRSATGRLASSDAGTVEIVRVQHLGEALFPLRGQGRRTDSVLALQKDLLASYEESSRAWLARVQSEVALWCDLASKLTATHTVPEAFETYANCISQRMKMAADDGRLLADEAQKITQKITKVTGQWRMASRECELVETRRD